MRTKINPQMNESIESFKLKQETNLEVKQEGQH